MWRKHQPLSACSGHLQRGDRTSSQGAFTGAGWKYYFLFVFWDIFEFVFIYFFFVETKNRTLEELTEIFSAPKPVQYSLKKAEFVIHGEEGVTKMLEKNNV